MSRQLPDGCFRHRVPDRNRNLPRPHHDRDRWALAAIKATDAVVVVGVLVNGDIHGADPCALVAVGTQVHAPLKANDADTVK